MAARAARSGVTLRRVESPRSLSAVVASAAREHSGDTEYLAELAMWSGRYGSIAGVPAHNTPVPSHADFPARAFASPALPQPSGAEARDDAGVVVVLATATDDNLALLRAGEATGVVLLTATALGLSSCPLTEPLEIDATRDTVRSMVLDGDGFPQMLMRIGWAPLNADPLPATPRRPLSEVVQRLDGASISLWTRLSHHAHEPEQDHRAQDRGEQSEEPPAARGVEEEAQQEAAEERTDDTDDDVHQDALTAAFDDLPCDTACECANDDVADPAHVRESRSNARGTRWLLHKRDVSISIS